MKAFSFVISRAGTCVVVLIFIFLHFLNWVFISFACASRSPFDPVRFTGARTPGRLRGGLADERLARNLGMPVYECAIRIFLPRPDMQRIEGLQTEAIGSLEVMKDLSHELRGRARMLRIPRFGEDKIVGAGQLKASVWLRLVEHDLRTCRVHDSVAHQSVIDIVKTHCTRVRS